MISFGPFLNETIDFRKLENKGIFLITGDTGSGKTTIFDAISVALFGESSGDERTVASFKSDFDNSDQLMKLEFTFELRDRIYKVVRIPKQMRKKIRGDGFTEESGEISLYEYVNGVEKGIDFSKEANIKIQELIGLNAKQFRQIVMIPQGQFRNLITENSEEREKILKSIFDVYKYELFQKGLENKSNFLKNTLLELKNSLTSEILHIKCEKDSDLYAYIQEENKNVSWIIEKTRENIEIDKSKVDSIALDINLEKTNLINKEKELDLTRKSNDLIDKFERTIEEKKALEEQKGHYLIIKNKIEMGNKAFRIIPIEEHKNKRKTEFEKQIEFINSKESEKKKLEEELIKKENDYNIINSEESLNKLKDYKEKELLLSNMIPKIKEYEKLKISYESIISKYDEEQNKINRIQEQLKENQLLFKNIQNEKEKLQEYPLKIEKANNLVLDLNNKLELLEELNKNCLEYEDAHNKSIISEKNYIKIAKEKEDYQKAYDISQKHWLEGQAGILAQGLKDGEPCPVCGSIYHIKLAGLSANVPSKEDLDKLKTELKLVNIKFNEIQIEYVKDKQIKNNKKEQLEEIFFSIKKTFNFDLTFIKDTIEKFYEEKADLIKELLIQQEKELSKLKLVKTSLENLIKQEKDIISIIDNLEKELNVSQENQLKLFKEKTIKEGELSVILKDLPEEFHSEEILIKKVKDYRDKILDIEKRIEQSKQERDNKQKAIEIVSEIITEGKSVLEEKERLYKQELIAFEKALENNGFINCANFNDMKISESELNELKASLIEYEQSVSINQEKYIMLSIETKGLIKKDLSQIEQQIKTIKEKIELLMENKNFIDIRICDNSIQIEKIEKIHQQYKIKEKEHSIVNDLSSVANGSAKGSYKITFERYILSTFLQEVISAANIRLEKMTNSRYLIVRSNQTNDKRKHTGLDLEIFDYYTGKTRDINTLSGGEGFKAALSLALGLADVAQAYAGGIVLDTMFVDEGFGSLSTESLDSAINCLMDLQVGGRLVGIISHVQELKDRIDTQIIVEKTKTGSKIYYKGI